MDWLSDATIVAAIIAAGVTLYTQLNSRNIILKNIEILKETEGEEEFEEHREKLKRITSGHLQELVDTEDDPGFEKYLTHRAIALSFLGTGLFAVASVTENIYFAVLSAFGSLITLCFAAIYLTVSVVQWVTNIKARHRRKRIEAGKTQASIDVDKTD
jgi:Flp pilus assembly protein TadB